MSNLNSDSKHVKDNEHETAMEKGKRHPHVPRPFAKKTIVLILLIILILLVTSFLIFRSPDSHHKNDIKATEKNTSIDDVDTENSDYKTINGTAISTNTTETNIPEKVYHQRIEVPGDIVDKIARAELKDKNTAVNGQYNTGINKLETKSQRTYVSRQEGGKPTVKITATKTRTEKTMKFNELPLREIIENNHYTIQLSGSSTKKNLLKYIKEHKIQNYQIYETKRKDDTWFVVLKGDYPTLGDAKSALNALPNKLKNDKPWIRKGKSIHNDKQ